MKVLYVFFLVLIGGITLLIDNKQAFAQRGTGVKDKSSGARGGAKAEFQNLMSGMEKVQEDISLDVQRIETELRNPKLSIKIDRPLIEIPIDNSKLGNILLFIDEKAKQTFYRIKIEEMNVEPIEPIIKK